MARKPTLLIDEDVLGLEEFLRDMGWDTRKVVQGTSDDDVLRSARDNGYVVVTRDDKLSRRCKNVGVKCVDLGFDILARVADDLLRREFPPDERGGR